MRPIFHRRSRVRPVSRLTFGLLAATLPAVPALSQTAFPKASMPSTVAPASPSGPATSTAPAASTVGKTAVKPRAALDNQAFSGQFPLEAGDVLSVVIANHPEMSGNLPVTEAGKISLPILGNLTVAGKTIAQAEKLITAVVDTQLNNPQVTVTLVRSRARQVLVVGAVRSAGALNLNSGWRVSEAIDAAGGLAGEPDDLVATLARGKAQPQRLDLAKILTLPRDAANLTLQPGDILRFNLLPGRSISVAGDVKNPATFVMRRGNHLLDALVVAGGLAQKPETSKITLIRAGKETELNAVAAFSGRNTDANVPLQNGDLIMVQAVRTTVSVVALRDQVRNSGNLSLEGKAHVLQAVLAAGLTVEPSKVDVSIRRGSERIPINLERAAYDPSADVALNNGDILLFTPPAGPAVRVTGGVARPNVLNLKEDATLLDAIFAAGNLTAKPDEVKISILREIGGRQTVLSVDPVSLISLRDLGQNVRLKDGDLVMVNPVQTNTVFISGEVTSPSAYQLGENDGLVELLLRAGGATPFAALKQVQVTHRDNTSVAVDLSQATQPGASRVAVPLQAGDLVRVPRNPNQVLVMNSVQRPGYYAIPESGTLTVGNAILAAGGAVNRARLQDVAIVRRGANGEMKTQIVPVNQLANSKTPGAGLPMNVLLQPGDIVYVPEGKTSAPILQTALGTLSSLSVLRNLFGY